MLKLLLFSDVHITPRGEFSKPTGDGLTDYLVRVKRSLDWVLEQIEKHQPNAVLCLGDLFESTGYIDSVSLKVATEFFVKLENQVSEDVPILFLVGNHDSYSVEHRIHNLEFLNLARVHVFDRVSSFAVLDNSTPANEAYNGTKYHARFAVIPWAKAYDLDEIKKHTADASFCVSHADVIGLAYQKGSKKADKGLDVDAFDLPVFNGHYHSPSDIGSIHNIGALLSRNFHDVDSSPRGVTLLTYNKGKLSHELIINPHDIPFMDVLLDRESAPKWEELGASRLDGYFVRLRFDESLKEFAEQLSCLAMGARFEPLPKQLAEGGEKKVNESFSPESNFEQYVESVFLFDEEGDRERVLELGRSYIEKARKASISGHALPIHFNELLINNFQSLGDVRIDLSQPGLIFVQGRNEDDPADSNGSGKSTLPEALYWCLTSRSLREYTGDDVIRWSADPQTCTVNTSLDVDNKPFWVKRGRGPKELKLFEGENDVSCRLDADTDKQIQKLFGRSKDVLQHSVFLTSDLRTRFMALSFPDRIRLIEQVTDSEIYSVIHGYAKADHEAALRRRTKAENDIEQANKSLVAHNERLRVLNGQIIEAKRSQEEELAALKTKLTGAVGRRDAKQEEARSADERLRAASAKIQDIAGELNDAQTEANGVEKAIAGKKASLARMSEQLEQKQKLLKAGLCPTCGQKIDVHTPVAVDIDEITAKCEEEKEVTKGFRDDLFIANGRVSGIQREHQVLLQEMKAAQHALSTATAELSRLTSEVEQVKRLMHDVRSSATDLDAKRDEAKRTIFEVKQQLEEAEQHKTEAERDVRHYGWLLEAFSTEGIRAKMLTTVTLPFLNQRLEEYAEKLGLPCQLSNQRETKSVGTQDKLDVVLTGKRTYRGLSRGEKRKVDLAIQLAFNDLAIATGGSHINLLVCDEIIDPLDETGVNFLVEILTKKAENMCILLMSHKPHLGASFPTRWTVVKQNGVSRLEVE